VCLRAGRVALGPADVFSPSPAAIAAATRSAADTADRSTNRAVGETRSEPPRGLHHQPTLPDPARAGQRHQPHPLPDDQILDRGGLLLTAQQRRGRQRKRPGQRRLALSVFMPLGHLEPLAQQHRQVVLEQPLQLGGLGEVLVGDVTGVPDPGQQLRQPRLTVRGRRLDVDQPGQPGRQPVLILQPGDLLARRDPAVTLLVDAHEHLALRQVRPTSASSGHRHGP